MVTQTTIKGVHGYGLIRDPDTFNKFRFIEDIYQGEENPSSRAVHIPNVGDIVLDRTQGFQRWLEVQWVNETTHIPVMVEMNMSTISNNFSKDNQLLGVGPGYQSELWRLYLDQSVLPFVFAVDSRLHVYGKENTKYKIFLGTDTSSTTGKVISMDFNSNGDLLSEDLPLEKVAFASTDVVDTNLAVKAPRKGFTTTNLQDGDIVTMVTYTDEGHATSINTLLVHNTALSRNIESPKKYVTTISIDSPFLDKTENNTLIFPMNTPRDALALMGVVTYSDGTSIRIPIDGTRMALYGLDNYIPMKKDQNINLVLRYNLNNNEDALNARTNSERFVAVKYFGRTQQVDGSYSVNIFPIPTYISDSYGWKVRYMLYTLERDIAYDVTDAIRYAGNTEPLQPLLYNETQDVVVSLNLKDVNPTLKAFTHVQTFKVAFMGNPGPNTPTAWYLTHEKDQEKKYGKDTVCQGVYDPGTNRWKLNIKCNCESQKEWLDKLYYNVMPLYDQYSEAAPPKPTHFTLDIDGTSLTYPISAWAKTLDFPVGAYDGYGVVIMWSRIENGNHYQLAASPLCFNNLSEGNVSDHASNTTVQEGNTDSSIIASTIIDIDFEVEKIQKRGASPAVVEKYRYLLTVIKRLGLLKYDEINEIYQRIRTIDITPAMIANDIILLELEVNRINISDFNRDTSYSGYAPPSMESNRG